MLRYVLFLSLFFVVACAVRRATPYDFPDPVSTLDRPVILQEKQTYSFDGGDLTFDNAFDGARVNGVTEAGPQTYEVLITPENEPINPSPWYAMRIRSDEPRKITVRLSYPDWSRHRYAPKVSPDRQNWTLVDSSALRYGEDSTRVNISLNLPAGTTYLAGQEVINSSDVRDWIDTQLGPVVSRASAGSSREGRDLPVVHIAAGGQLANRPTVVILSRQHPPEVTGYLAMQAFIERIIEHPRREEFLDRYQLLVFPILNPDGVDQGHWRHTAGGIDSNRDWAYYRQPEARQVADYVVAAKGEVVLGLDFHSTFHDVYYTFDDSTSPSVLPGFKDAWLRGIEAGIGGEFRVNESPGKVGRPTSSGWFKTQFNAEGITYEIGDNTDRAFVKTKGRVSADAMIDVLLAD